MNVCVVGTGKVTTLLMPAFAASDVLTCNAVVSRSEDTGRSFARQWGIETVYTSMDEMLKDPSIDLVYVASPNSLHYQQTKSALLAGKHVLCEKPFVSKEAEAEELIAIAREKGLFLFEAITTAHHPHYAVIKEKLSLLGKIKLVSATFCQYSSRYPALLEGKVSPAFDPAYHGGALMDINLYNIHFVLGLFGAPRSIRYRANLHSNGVDTSGILTMEYPDFLCQCIGAKDCDGVNGIHILGEEGWMEVTPAGSNPQTVKLCLRGREPEIHTIEKDAWYHEVQSLGKLIAADDHAACCRLLETTRQVVAVLEAARKDAGLCF